MTTESAAAYRRIDHSQPRETEEKPYIAGLMWSPLKSGASIYSDRLYLGRDGFRPTKESVISDRSFTIIDANSETGKIVTQREKARLALVRMTIAGGAVSLQFDYQLADAKIRESLPPLARNAISFLPAMHITEQSIERSVQVHATPGIAGIDQGDFAANWLSSVIGKPVRLMYQHPEQPRVREETAPGHEELQTILRFQDSYPATALSIASLKILNDFFAQSRPDYPAFTAENFRMNMLFGGKINEHLLIGAYVKFGEAVLYGKRSKERCPMPAVDAAHGVMRKPNGLGSLYQQDLATLHDALGIPENERFRTSPKGAIVAKPQFGVDLIPITEGYVSVHDAIEIIAA